MGVWGSEVDGMGPGSCPVAGVCRPIFKVKPPISVIAMFYK